MLRHNETASEKILWQRLSKNQLLGFRFKRQHPIAHYIVDFYCHKAKLVIELDGTYHERRDQITYDSERTEVLRSFGLTILRFPDEEILNDLNAVIKTITKNLPLSNS